MTDLVENIAERAAKRDWVIAPTLWELDRKARGGDTRCAHVGGRERTVDHLRRVPRPVPVGCSRPCTRATRSASPRR